MATLFYTLVAKQSVGHFQNTVFNRCPKPCILGQRRVYCYLVPLKNASRLRKRTIVLLTETLYEDPLARYYQDAVRGFPRTPCAGVWNVVDVTLPFPCSADPVPLGEGPYGIKYVSLIAERHSGSNWMSGFLNRYFQTKEVAVSSTLCTWKVRCNSIPMWHSRIAASRETCSSCY